MTDPVETGQLTLGSSNYWQMEPIGFLESSFAHKNATPRQPSICPKATARLMIRKEIFTNPSYSLAGLQEFSHVWLLFIFHVNDQKSYKKSKVAPPRLDGAKLGVFSTRSPHRPNPIGLSLVKLENIIDDTLYLSGIDMLDGTPVLDLKPYIPMYDYPLYDETAGNQAPEPSSVTGTPEKRSGESEIRVPEWVRSAPVQKLSVSFTARASTQLATVYSKLASNEFQNQDELKRILTDILAEDPRSVYRRHSCKDQLYYFTFNSLHLTCWFDDGDATIEVVKVRLQDDVK